VSHRTVDFAADMARAGRIDAISLQQMGVIDAVVAERPDAADEPVAFCRRLGGEVERQLADVFAEDPTRRLLRRQQRIRRLTQLQPNQPKTRPITPVQPHG
jgi:acetyl-CoA carboxylase carboxyl transferase subunit beta